MNGTQRLSVIHSLLNPYKPFLFDYQRDISAKRLQTTKDCIAPTQIDFRPDGHYNDCVKLDNGVYAQVLVMKKFGSELSDRALADMTDNFKEIGSLFGREGAGAGFAKQTDKESFTYAFA